MLISSRGSIMSKLYHFDSTHIADFHWDISENWTSIYNLCYNAIG